MAFAGFDAELLGALDAAGASPAQAYLLQTVLQGIEPDTLLSQHAAARRGLAAEIVQACEALMSFSTASQPRPQLLARLCGNAADSCARALPFSAGDPLLPALAAALPPVQEISSNSAASRAAAAASAAALAPLLRRLPAYINGLFARAWALSSARPADSDLLANAALETACALAAIDRDRRTLQAELTAALDQHGPDLAAVQALLMPPPAAYRYACEVQGASGLDELDELSPGARQLTGTLQADPAWGSARPQLVKWLAAQDRSGTSVVVDIEVIARDRASAARLGRRQLVEVLDQYMAGHRILRLVLAPSGIACRIGSHKPAEDAPKSGGVNRAYPLVPHWPAGLRETLRMAHLARTTDSPMAAAALAWSAVEATGLPAEQRPELAAALSLQAMRQQVMNAHQHLGQDADARVAYNTTRIRAATRALSKLTGALDQCGPGHPKHDIVRARQAAAGASLAQAEGRAAALVPLRTALAGLARYCGMTPHGYLDDLNSWVDVLLPARPTDPASLTEARAALETALPTISPLARRQIQDWQQRLTDPRLCADWLELTQSRLAALLDAVYAARNMTLHSGVFETTGDAVLGQGAVMTADMLLEFLGNWYRHISPPPAPAQPPAEIILDLAARQGALVARLRGHSSAANELNVGWLTSPSTVTAWDRA